MKNIDESIEDCVYVQMQAATKVIPKLNKIDDMSARERIELMKNQPAETVALLTCYKENRKVGSSALDYIGFQECME